MSNHLQRLLVAIAGIPIVIFVTIAGGWFFFLFVAFISGLALYEFFRLTESKGMKPLLVPGIIAGFFVNLAFFNNKLSGVFSALSINLPLSEAQFLLIVVLVVVPLFSLIELFRNNGSAILNLSGTFFGIFYISLFFGSLIGVRELFTTFHIPVYKYIPDSSQALTNATIDHLYVWGGYTVVSIYAMIWLCDSAAYYVGKSIGKHKLFPRVSPNKSWEGSIAGFIVAVAAAIGAKMMVLGYLKLHEAIILGVIVGVFGQLGDLIESLLKRDAGVKDSSNIIPGHGGVFDRFDSLLLVAPLAYLYLDFIVFS